MKDNYPQELSSLHQIKPMKVSAIHCKNCNTIIYSRCRDDIRSCRCFKSEKENVGIAINGGFDYVKVIVSSTCDYEFLHVDIGDVSLVDLYRDWSGGVDKYGVIND